MAAATPSRSLRISTISALSIAMSVPLLRAIPTSAAASAGASLIPSPTIAVFLCVAASEAIAFSLSCGRSSATASSILTVVAMALAVILLSPVNITVCTFISLSSATACVLVDFSMSATAMIPTTPSLQATISTVLPSASSRSTSAIQLSVIIPLSFINSLLPTK